MTNEQDQLTEIEGAILSEIEHRGNATAFKVRRAFQLSPSIEWSGSAGSVYPAVKRLIARGFILANATGDGRSTKTLSLSGVGKAALHARAIASDRATSVGIDPFRLRAGIWMTFEPDERRRVMEQIRASLCENISFLEQEIEAADSVEATRLGLNLRLHQDRIDWLDEALAKALRG